MADEPTTPPDGEAPAAAAAPSEPVGDTVGATPIAGENPAGGSPNDAPDWEEFDLEAAKIGGLDQADINWPRLAAMGKSIIEKSSKDLKVAGITGLALWTADGLPGALEGVKIVNDICANYWDQLSTRPKGRINALQNLTDKLHPGITDLEVATEDKPLLEEMKGLFDKLEKLSSEKLEGKNVGMFKMVRLMDDKLGMLEGEGGDAEGAEGAAAGGGGGGGGAPGRGGGGGGGAMSTRGDAYKRLKEVAEFMQKNEPLNPITYLVNRASRWTSLRLEEIMKELLGNEQNARKRTWEHLGIEEEQN